MPKSLSLVLIFLFLFAFSCKSLKQPEFRNIENLQLGSLKGGKLTLTADAIFFNPNKVSATLKSTDLDVFIKEMTVGKILQSNEVEVPANSEVRVPLSADVTVGELLGNLGGVLGALLKQELDVHIKGNATIKALGVPVTVPVDHIETVQLNL